MTSNTNSVGYRLLTDDEMEIVREQLRIGNKLAREAARRRGVKIHPRIAKIKGKEQ